MIKSRLIKISIGIISLSVLMFLIGIDTFTYQGAISAFYKQLGMISFMFWFPTLIIGIVLLSVSFWKKYKNNSHGRNNKFNTENE